ncbi:MAG: transporter substrate-binding domain-containing protein [Clostridiaceae bacterium]
MKYKKISIMIAFALMIVSLVGCSSSKEGTSDNDKDEIVVGMELAYPPFETTDANGDPTGISVDLAKALGEYLDRPVKIENMSYTGLIPALTTNKIDMVLSSMTITEERGKVVNFSDPYAKSYLSLLINKDSSVKSADDLNDSNITIAVKKGTTGHVYASEHFKNAKINVYDSVSACVLDVSQGKADVFIYDQLTVYENWQKYIETTRVNLEPFQDDFEYWGIAMRKEDEDLQKNVNEFLKQYKENGEFDDLANSI